MIRRLYSIGVLLGLALLCATATVTAADDSSALLPTIPPATKGEACVEPTDIMRREHMHFLTHQRDDTVHGGIRGAKHSLVGCIDCHAQTDARGAAIPVNAKGQFCESCHNFAGARMDCFECHATVPAGKKSSAVLPEWMSPATVSVARVPGAD